jgi:hypothetical protein
MSKFEDRLWSELVCDYGPELARQTRAPIPVRPRVRRAPALAAAAALLSALVVAAVIFATRTGTSPTQAYTVSQGSDGLVSISVNELTGIAGANAQLAGLGVRIRVAAVEQNCSQVGQIVLTPPSLTQELVSLGKRGVTVQPNLIPAEDTLVLSARQIGPIVGLSYGLYRDPPPSCVKEGDSHVG